MAKGLEEPRLRSAEEFEVKMFGFFVGFSFCNRVSSSLRNKTGLFWETENWFGPYVGLKACETKELRTDWFLKLDKGLWDAARGRLLL